MSEPSGSQAGSCPSHAETTSARAGAEHLGKADTDGSLLAFRLRSWNQKKAKSVVLTG